MRGWRVEDITLPLHSDLLTVANSPHQLGWLNQIILQQNVVKDVYCNHGVFPIWRTLHSNYILWTMEPPSWETSMFMNFKFHHSVNNVKRGTKSSSQKCQVGIPPSSDCNCTEWARGKVFNMDAGLSKRFLKIWKITRVGYKVCSTMWCSVLVWKLSYKRLQVAG